MQEGPELKDSGKKTQLNKQPAVSQKTEYAEAAPEGVENKVGNEKAARRPERSREEIEQERISLEAKIASELTELNRLRQELDLPPVETSEAVKAYHNQLAKLPKVEGGVPEESKPGNQFENESNITPEIRYYFNEILGRDETMRRMQEMGPGAEAKIRDLITGGKLNDFVWRFTLLDPELRERAKEVDRPWNEQLNKVIKERGLYAAFYDPSSLNQPSHRLYQDRLFRDVQRSMRRQGAPGNTERQKPLTKEEQAIHDKISQIPDEFSRLKQLFSQIDIKTRRLILSDESLLNGTPKDYAQWQKYLDPVFKQMNI